MEIDDLKKEYALLTKKYGLPDYVVMNQIFEIEKIDRESEILLKIIRKVMVEKVVHSLGFVEMLLSPMNAPQMYHAYIKGMSGEDKSFLEKVYVSFSELSNESLMREMEYDEGKEVELIKKVFKVWDDSKGGFMKVLEGVSNPGDGETRARGYLG